MATAPRDPVISPAQARAHYGDCSNTHLWNLQRAGLFPKPIHLGPRMRGFYQSEVAAVLAARARGASDEEIRALVRDLEAKRMERAA